jgi:alpha-mannosidase
MLHMIGNAHIDPVWLWRWPEGCAEAIGTCWAAIDRLEEGDGFVFTRGEALIYTWIEELEPKLFDRIRHFIKLGRWVVANGWWIQPDCNVPAGESIIRQALYGKRYFADRFGVDVPVGYNVDSFGHAATFPMLLRHTGSTSYVFMRPGPHEMANPADLFDWVSPDGSRIATFRIPIAYGTWNRGMPLDEKIDVHLEMSRAANHPFMCFYGVGNHGGGPTRETIARIEARQTAGEPLLFSDPTRFFAATADVPRPEITTELQFHAIGCYAAAADLKALNRRAEARLTQAEAAATLAFRQMGAPYPREKLAKLWQMLMFNQFHDTLGGTSLESACNDAKEDFGAILSGAAEVFNTGVRQLASTVRPAPDPKDSTLLLVNLNPDAFDGIVEAEPWTDFDAVSPRLLLDDTGTIVPFQYISPEGKTNGLQRLAFRATLPGYGYRLLRFAVRPEGRPAPDVNFGHPLGLDELVHETPGWRLVVDGTTGAIASLVNRATGQSVFTGPAHLGTLIDDPTDTWSHGIACFSFEGEPTRLRALNLLEDGPLRRSIEMITTVGNSRFATSVILPASAELPVDLRVRLDWHEQHKLLRIAFPLAGSRFEYEIAAGWTERPDDGLEVAGHRWVRAVRPGLAVTIANDAKYSYAAQHGTLYITATRSPVYSHHDPVALQPGAVYRYMDQGEQCFALSIAASSAGTRQDAMRLADALLKPPVVTPHVSRGGTAPHIGQWLDVRTGSGAVIALKCAEDGDATIIRAIELNGVADQLIVAGRVVPIKPRGIVSAALADGTMREVDGLER